MTVIEEIQNLSQEVGELRRSDNRKQAEKKIRLLLEDMRQKSAAFKRDMEQLHESARLVTSKFKSASLAAEVWKELSEDLSIALLIFTSIPETEPRFDRLIKESQAVIRDLLDKADQEYRSHAETAYLLGSNANAKRLSAALEEADSGNLPIFDSADDMLKALREK